MPDKESKHALAIQRANRQIYNILEKGLRKAAAQGERGRLLTRKRRQRALYNSGAAKSPTPPPQKSTTRDIKTVKLLGSIEDNCQGKNGILVKELAQNFLFEQDLLDESKCTVAVWRDKDIELAMRSARDLKEVKRLNRRLTQRHQRSLKPIYPYNWDKVTHVLKMPFYAWSMPVEDTRSFTVNLSEKVIERAKASPQPLPSYCQDRLRKLLQRRDASHIENWFVVEPGGSNGMHLHGAISGCKDERSTEAVKSALKVLSGNDDHTAVHLGQIDNTFGWAAYCSKHARFAQLILKGTPLTGSRSVQRRARQLYDEFHRECRTLMKT